MNEYETLCSDFLELFAAGCYHAEDWLDSLWSEALTIISGINENGRTSDMLLRLRRYPALLLLYAGGVASVAGERYKTLAALLNKTKVRRWGGLEKVSFALAPATVVDRYDREHLAEFAHNPMPLELHLQNRLRKALGGIIHGEDQFLDCFTRFEYLFTLDGLANDNGVILGSYMWVSEIRRKYRQSYFRGTIPIIGETNAEIERDGAEWLPFKSGLYSGNWEQFIDFKNKADKKILEQAENVRLHRNY